MLGSARGLKFVGSQFGSEGFCPRAPVFLSLQNWISRQDLSRRAFKHLPLARKNGQQLPAQLRLNKVFKYKLVRTYQSYTACGNHCHNEPFKNLVLDKLFRPVAKAKPSSKARIIFVFRTRVDLTTTWKKIIHVVLFIVSCATTHVIYHMITSWLSFLVCS